MQKLGRDVSDGYDIRAVADDIYISNDSGSNIGAHTYNTYQYA